MSYFQKIYLLESRPYCLMNKMYNIKIYNTKNSKVNTKHVITDCSDWIKCIKKILNVLDIVVVVIHIFFLEMCG